MFRPVHLFLLGLLLSVPMGRDYSAAEDSRRLAEPGDTVVTVRECPVTLGAETRGIIEPGTVVVVRRVDGTSYSVATCQDGKLLAGLVSAEGTCSLDVAIGRAQKDAVSTSTSADAWLALASLYVARGDVERAIETATVAIHMDSGKAQAYRMRAVARTLRDDWEGALADCNQATRLAPSCLGEGVGVTPLRLV